MNSCFFVVVVVVNEQVFIKSMRKGVNSMLSIDAEDMDVCESNWHTEEWAIYCQLPHTYTVNRCPSAIPETYPSKKMDTGCINLGTHIDVEIGGILEEICVDVKMYDIQRKVDTIYDDPEENTTNGKSTLAVVSPKVLKTPHSNSHTLPENDPSFINVHLGHPPVEITNDLPSLCGDTMRAYIGHPILHKRQICMPRWVRKRLESRHVHPVPILRAEVHDSAVNLNDIFTIQDIRKRRHVLVRHTHHGSRPFISPIWLNGLRRDGVSFRPDVAWAYGEHVVSGATYCTTGRLGYEEHTGKWKRMARDDHQSYPISFNVNLFDKIKVMNASSVRENVTRIHILTGSVGVQNRSANTTCDTFPQEVSKCDEPHGTIALHKIGDACNTASAHHNASTVLSSTNTNMPRGSYEQIVLLRANAVRTKYACPGSLVEPKIRNVRENNNSITCDSVISSVENELCFKKNAERTDIPFKLVSKGGFRTHKLLIEYDLAGEVHSGDSPKMHGDPTSAAKCTCWRCGKDDIGRHGTRRRTFHKRKMSGTKSTSDIRRIVSQTGDNSQARYSDAFNKRPDAEWLRTCLAPLANANEIQVHDRCFNCSAVCGTKLMPVICNLAGKMLSSTPYVRIDIALVSCKAYVEYRSNGLLPSIFNDLCEMMCWMRRTRFMSTRKQFDTYRRVFRPILARIVVSRYNYAQAVSFSQRRIRGARALSLEDRELVTHKYRSASTLALFSKPSKREVIVKDDGYGAVPVPASKNVLTMQPRRNVSIERLFFRGSRIFPKAMVMLALDTPQTLCDDNYAKKVMDKEKCDQNDINRRLT